MFDVGASELLVIAIVAILVIGPKDMPMALRTAGRWIARIRRVSGHFRSGLDAMIREAEMEEMDRKWRERNEAIMARHPDEEFHPEEQAGGHLAGAEARADFPSEGTPPELPAPAPEPDARGPSAEKKG